MLESEYPEIASRRQMDNGEARAWIERFRQLGDLLNIHTPVANEG